MSIRRILKHLFMPDWLARRPFPEAALARIGQAIGDSERTHEAELRFVLEAGLDLVDLLRGMTPRQRAERVFAAQRVWDTERNSGVLLYLQLVDRDIEIVADRGIAGLVRQEEWEAICQRMEEAFRAGRFEAGTVEGIRDITALLVRHFPARGHNPDELPDKPLLL
ncbi:MAG: hypothetical protein A3I02_01645 [Betaproteobacteria bacterium RIFCSPLOWO2_02_FULL_67_26]|nr:MAG: hypothetical protein A3I02_01645 [Betaproteobacteria bacterium RIFCSPLOWO2_02_FULL_67_26]